MSVVTFRANVIASVDGGQLTVTNVCTIGGNFRL